MGNAIFGTPGDIESPPLPWGKPVTTIRVNSLRYYISIALLISCAWGVGITTLAAQGPNENELALHFRAGQQAFQAGQFGRAIEEYKKVLQLDPDLAEARVNLGLAYHSLGRYEDAISELEKARVSNPRLLPANLFLGLDYLKLGMNRKASAALRQALSIDPANKEALRGLAVAALAQGNYEEAGRNFRAEFAHSSNPEEAWFSLGHDYLDMAKQLAADLTDQHQASGWAHRLQGDLWSERRSWNDAALAYRRALYIDPRQQGLYARLGMVELAQQKAEDAEAEFQAELKRDPLDEHALLGLAETALGKNAPTAALETLSKIWDIDPSFLAEQADYPVVNLAPEVAARLAAALPEPGDVRGASAQSAREVSSNSLATAPLHFLKSALLRVAGDKMKAQAEHETFMRQFRQWQSASPAQPGGQSGKEACEQHRYPACTKWLESRHIRTFDENLLLGHSLLALHEDERASEAFAAAMAQEPNDPAAIYWLLRTYRRLADDCFARLADASPDSWRIHQMKAEIYLSSAQNKPAIEEYQLALEKQPGSAELHAALGALYLRMKSLSEARIELDKALALDPTAAETLYWVGQLYVAERKPAEAIPYLQNALRRDPSLVTAHAALGKAYLRAGNAQLAVPELEKSLPLDHYGDLHFLLSQAYRQLGENALAQRALSRSQELRKTSAAADQGKLVEAGGNEDAGP